MPAADPAGVNDGPVGQVDLPEAPAGRPQYLCPHGRARTRCKDCPGVKTGLCEHGRRRSHCKPCGGSSFCEHQRQRSRCKLCHGAGICEHKRERSSCKDCGGSRICPHNKHRAYCKECSTTTSFGTSFCVHQRERRKCVVCQKDNVCEHQRVRTYCKECRASELERPKQCQHGLIRKRCKDCTPGAILDNGHKRKSNLATAEAAADEPRSCDEVKQYRCNSATRVAKIPKTQLLTKVIGPSTINNPTANDFELCRKAVENGVLRYVTFNYEKGTKEDPPHIQIFAQSRKAMRTKAWQMALGGRVSGIVATRSVPDAIDHCQGFKIGTKRTERREGSQEHDPEKSVKGYEEYGQLSRQGCGGNRRDPQDADQQINDGMSLGGRGERGGRRKKVIKTVSAAGHAQSGITGITGAPLPFQDPNDFHPQHPSPPPSPTPPPPPP